MIRSRVGLSIALLGAAGCAQLFGKQPATSLLEVFRTHEGYGGDENFGAALCDVGDWTGDGRPEYAIGSHDEVRIISGAKGGTLRRIAAPPGTSGFGGAFCSFPDLDADGKCDLAVGVLGRWPDATWDIQVLSSKDSRVLRTFHAEGVGTALVLLPDPLDPFDSLLLAACRKTSANGEPAFGVLAFRCRDAKLAYRFDDPELHLAADVARCGDVDGDGFPDFAVPGPNRSVFVVSGRSGQLVRTFQASIQGRILPTDDALDLDGDGTPDVALAEVEHDTMAPEGGVEILSGRDGRHLWSTRCLVGGGAFFRVGCKMALAVAVPGRLLLFDLPAETPSYRLGMPLSTGNPPNLTWIGDLDGDGRDELGINDGSAHGLVVIVAGRTLEELLRR